MPYKDKAAQRAAQRRYNAKRVPSAKKRVRTVTAEKAQHRSRINSLLNYAVAVVSPKAARKGYTQRHDNYLQVLAETNTLESRPRFFQYDGAGYTIQMLRHEEMTAEQFERVFYYRDGLLYARATVEQIAYIRERAAIDGRSAKPYTVTKGRVFFHRAQVQDADGLRAILKQLDAQPVEQEQAVAPPAIKRGAPIPAAWETKASNRGALTQTIKSMNVGDSIEMESHTRACAAQAIMKRIGWKGSQRKGHDGKYRVWRVE